MRPIEVATLADALGYWGDHEARGSRRTDIAEAWGEAALELPGLAIACLFRPNLIGPILFAQPCFTRKVELDASDVAGMETYDHLPVEKWAPGDPVAAAHVRSLAAQDRVRGALVCLAATSDGTLAGVEGPIRVFDGLHRLAAWRQHLEAGETYPMTAFLIGCRNL